jgi:hypothetical protein
MYEVSNQCTLRAMNLLPLATSLQLAAGGGVVAILGLDGSGNTAHSAASCTDTYRDCGRWRDELQCTTNTDFMRRYCPYSCQTCPEAATESGMQCLDGVDNDRDGDTDCDDEECRAHVPMCRMSSAQQESMRLGLCAAHRYASDFVSTHLIQ